MIDLGRLRALHAVATYGSVGSAAEALGYTPSAVSQQLAKLERETRTTLLEKRGRGVVLTDAAQQLATTAAGTSDFIIVGGGIAGLRAASALAPAGRVVILTKADATESNTGYAQGGIAAAIAPDDSVERHVADTLAAGAGLCDEAAVRVLVGEGPRYVRELIEWGAQFDRTPEGALVFGLEAAHSVHRILHAGDALGRHQGERPLVQHAAHGDQRPVARTGL